MDKMGFEFPCRIGTGMMAMGMGMESATPFALNLNTTAASDG